MTTVLLPEPMLRFRCNLQGCCCMGWGITFEASDLMRVIKAFTPAERPALLSRWTFWLEEGQQNAPRFSFCQEPPSLRCEFLAEDGRCGLQVVKGLEVLPNLCKAFPGFAFRLGDARELELHFDLICPEVLNLLERDEAPYTLTRVESDELPDVHMRLGRRYELPDASLGPFTLSLDQLHLLRERILTALADPSRSAFDAQALVAQAVARAVEGAGIEDFEVRAEDPVAAFETFFYHTVGIHDGAALALFVPEYQRFLVDFPTGELPWSTLPTALAFDPEWPSRLDMRDPRFDPLFRRYLAHRYFAPFNRSPAANRMHFSWGTILHSLATSVRFAVGFARWLERPVDLTVLKWGICLSEGLYRSLSTPATAMPWFGLDPERPDMNG